MAGLFNSVVSMGKAAIMRIQGPLDPCAVVPVSSRDYVKIPVVRRSGCLVLHGPRETIPDAAGKSYPYDIVVHSETDSCFSLERGVDLDKSEIAFTVLENVIPALLDIDVNLFSQTWLQSICDYVRKNPSESIAHVVVFFDLRSAIGNAEVERYHGSQNIAGVTPLMIAVQKENAYMVQYLASKKELIQAVDNQKRNVFHYAAVTNKTIIELLEQNFSSDVINAFNSTGDTPLHVACKNDKPDCVQALLCAGADVNVTGTLDDEAPIYSALHSSSTRCVKEIIQMYPKQIHTHDMKHGGTPLHWAKSKDLIEALIDLGCCVDAKNFNGKTALHVMVEHGRLDCVLALVTSGADINSVDNAGNTALHLAVKGAKVTVVRALITFDCKANVANNDGETPWTLAQKMLDKAGIVDYTMNDREGVLYSLYASGVAGDVTPLDKSGKERTFKKIKSTPQYRRVRSLFDETLAQKARRIKSRPGEENGKGRLLSLDGGGIKGLVLCRMLMSMEAAFGVPIVHCFDWICGTSTGGMLALALASGKTPKECLNIYMKLKDKVFVDSKPYNTKNLEDLVIKEFGSRAKLSDIKEPKIMVTATIADRNPPDLQLFRNYQSPQDMMGIRNYDHPDLSDARITEDYLIWKAARASGAAPSFFRPEGRFVDGGILANNPSLTLLTEIAEYNAVRKALDHEEDVVKPSVLVSLGTGVPPVKKTKVVDIFRPDSAQDTLKLFMNWDGMGRLLLESVLDADTLVVDQTRAWCLSTGVAYHRLSPQMNQDIELDEKDEKVLIDLMWTTMVYMHDKKEEVMTLKSRLVN